MQMCESFSYSICQMIFIFTKSTPNQCAEHQSLNLKVQKDNLGPQVTPYVTNRNVQGYH